MKDIFMADEVLSLPWAAPGRELTLKQGEIHVWRANLEIEEKLILNFTRILSPDEFERSERYYFKKDRNHFIAARGILRTILGGYLNIDPGDLCFTYSTLGKPSISGEQNANGLFFNISHSYGFALYAFSYCGEIGIDIERIRPDQHADTIISEIFSQREIAALSALSSKQREKSFFACWVRKEAFLKACGTGLSLAPDRIEVSLTAGGPSALLSIEGDYSEASLWSLRDLDVGPGYAAALAVRRHNCQVKCLEWG
jgi:4'-phosphopantetheinyl transferase